MFPKLLAVAALALAAAPALAQREGRGPARGDARGLLKAVDPAARTITITVPEGRQAAVEKSFTLAPDAEIAVDSSGRRGILRAAKLADFPAGTPVALTLA